MLKKKSLLKGLTYPLFLGILYAGLSPIFVDNVMAKELGRYGEVFLIEEKDPLQTIKARLKYLNGAGFLFEKQKQIQDLMAQRVKRPHPVQGLKTTTHSRTFYYDPSIVLTSDLADHKGRVFYKKGTRVNPLKTLSWRHPYLFINGDDPAQCEMIKSWRDPKTKIILIAGSPLEVSDQIKNHVFFDQFGTLVKKLKIRQVPALVTQEGLNLKIEEFMTHQFITKKRK